MSSMQYEAYVEANQLTQRALSTEGHDFTRSKSKAGGSEGSQALLKTLKEASELEEGEINPDDDITKKMWTKEYIGLYAHYAGVGINGGIQGLILNFCVYYFQGAASLCPNAQSIIFLPWSFKIFYAILTDSFRPWGYRRKPYIIAGWLGCIFFTFLLAVLTPTIGSSGWVLLSVGTMVFLMLADVPADGYSVELGKLEAPEHRGQILATGQRIRFITTMMAGAIQAFMMNGPTTNPASCPIDTLDCWEWGMTVSQYYWVIFALLTICFIPVLWLKEIDAKDIPMRSFSEHAHELWETCTNATTLYLLIYVTGTQIFSGMVNISSTYMQYYVIGLTNLQAGINSILQYLALVIAIMLFQTFLINRNWRTTQYMSSMFTALLGLQWLLVFFNTGGLRNPWFTIFINMNQIFSQGITQVLFAMAVIELAKPGQEAITYEMIVSVANAGSTLNTIIATQLLQVVDATICDTDVCPAGTIDTSTEKTFEDTDGPQKFQNYTFMILGINFAALLIFTQFLPKQKEECHEWRVKGELAGNSQIIGWSSIILSSVSITYGILCSIMLVNEKTSCLQAFGGSGC